MKMEMGSPTPLRERCGLPAQVTQRAEWGGACNEMIPTPWTSRPVTAILTRRVFQMICLLLGLSLIFGACTGSEDAAQRYLWSCLHGREALPIRVLDIHVEAYGNVFPDLAARLPGNRQLTVQAGGLYLNDDNHLLRDKCNISMMSPAWVHIECTQAISSHGFWLYAVDDASEGMGGAGVAFVDRASGRSLAGAGEAEECLKILLLLFARLIADPS